MGKIGSTWYYFDSEGWMKTGWIKEYGKWYYLDDSGAMKTGWCWVSGSWYYLNTSGVMQTGLQTINGKQYYLSSSGDMQVGWHNIGDDTYFFASSGARQTINRRALVLGKHQREQYLSKTLMLWKRYLVTKTLAKLFDSQIKLSPRLLQKWKSFSNLLAKAM